MPTERVRRKIVSLLDEAESALTRNDWRAAIQCANAVLALDPDHEDALEFRAAAERAVAEADITGSQPPPRSAQSSITFPREATTRSELPSFANGRYVVKKFVGEGGKKKVYLAHDAVLDRDVAIALIKTHGLDDAALKRILREAQAMARLGDHPNIVPIYDLGTENGRPFMVLPLMKGGDVGDLIEKLRADAASGPNKAPTDGPALPFEQMLSITRDVCEGLAFAHSKGIVHRDLKPGNVWLTERGHARIGDFGLALPLDQSRLTREGFMVGTVAYMPPEQAMGGDITTGADLYSLGCMLYEMVTGRPPFLGDDDIAIIGQHINTPPVAPSWHNPRCPKPLEALIMRLLAKDPARRPESAEAVLDALRGLAVSLDAADETVRRRVDTPLDSMASGVFVGRRRELARLQDGLDASISGSGQLISLVGDDGMGKTRIAEELVTYARLRKCTATWGRCYERAGAPPYWPWIQAIRDYVETSDQAQIEAAMGKQAAVIVELVPSLAEKLPELPAVPELDSPEARRFRLFDAVSIFLRQASKQRPIVIVLDDLHLADPSSLLLLEFVAREISKTRVLLLGTYRESGTGQQVLPGSFASLARDQLIESVHLRGWSQQEVAQFIEMASGSRPVRNLTRAVFEQTEGNPLFVTEVVRLLVQDGRIGLNSTEREPPAGGQRKPARDSTVHPPRSAGADRQTGTRRPESVSEDLLPIPAGLRAVIGQRISGVSEDCRRLLQSAAVLGRSFPLEVLTQTTLGQAGMPLDVWRDRVRGALAEAVSGRLIQLIDRDQDAYQFTHGMVQQVLLLDMAQPTRVGLHATAATALEHLYGPAAYERADELAWHFTEAESLLGAQKAARYQLAAGRQALDRYAYEDAAEHFDKALARLRSEGDLRERADAMLGLATAGNAVWPADRVEEVVGLLREASVLYLSLGDEGKTVEAATVRVHTYPGRRSGIGDVIRTSLSNVPSGSVAAARLTSRLARVSAVEEGGCPDAQAGYKESLRMAEVLGERELRSEALLAGAEVELQVGSFSTSAQLAARAVSLARESGNEALVDEAQILSALCAGYQGRLSDLEELVARQDAESSATGWRDRTMLDNQASAFQFRGQWSGARSALQAYLDTVPDWPRGLIRLFRIEALTGNWDEAERLADRALQLLLSSRSEPDLEHTAVSTALAVTLWLRPNEVWERAADDIARGIAGLVNAPPLLKLFTTATEGCLAVHRHDADAARRAYATLNWPELEMLGTIASKRHLRAMLAAACGELDQARHEFTAAITFLRDAGLRPYLASALADFATLPEGQPGEHDPQLAAQLNAEALRVARDLEMKPLVQALLSRRRFLKA